MHISEGILSVPVLAGGGVLAAGAVAAGLRRLDDECIPRVALLSAAFFVASLIHVPIGPSAAHLVLNGLLGVMLGWVAFPAILIALLLQAALFGYGGLTTLGVNTIVMGAPALASYFLLNYWLRRARGSVAFGVGFAAGVTGIIGGCLLLAAALLTTGQAFRQVAALVLVAHIPVAVIEGLVTGAAVTFLGQVKPELLAAPAGTLPVKETADA
jgi:cobalt/nickel transport system permease protein